MAKMFNSQNWSLKQSIRAAAESETQTCEADA
jgi:hypothetical protein